MPRKATAKKATKKAAKKFRNVDMVKAAKKPAQTELEQFREAATQYLRADENAKLYAKRRDAQKPIVKSYIEQHAAELDGKSRGLVDNAVKWMLVPGAMKVDEAAGVAVLEAAIAKAKGERKRVLEACLRPTVDKDAWERAKQLGFLDDEMIAAYERGRTQSIKWTQTDQISCPECRAVSKRTAKFCGQCGTDLTKMPEYLT